MFFGLLVLLLSIIAQISLGLLHTSRIFTKLSHERVPAIHLSTADFRNGMTFEIEGFPVRLQEFLHVKAGRAAAIVRTKYKNLMTGSVQERTFRAGESIIAADVTKTEMKYTYSNGDMLCFMNMETFEEQAIDKSKFDNVDLLVEGMSCEVIIWKDQIIDVQLPHQMEYTVIETPPNFKGNTAVGGQKPAKLNGGATVNVPMFIEVGEKIIVSTADCKYLNRANAPTF